MDAAWDMASSLEWLAALAVMVEHWDVRSQRAELTAGSAERYTRVFESFTRYAASRGASRSGEVSEKICDGFLKAALAGHRRPSPSTSRLRLMVLRDAFRGLIEAGLCSADPTAGLQIQRQGGEPVPYPLTPVEVDRLQIGCRLRASDTLRPAVVAAALAGASHAEIARLMVSDADLDGGFLILGSNRSRRTVLLDGASLTALRARVAALRRASRCAQTGWDRALVPLAMHQPVSAYPLSSVAPTVSMNLSRAMSRAGITRPGVRPRSVREYAANRVYAQTKRVEDVTQLLGSRSLDSAFRFIDSAWQQQWGEVIRAAHPTAG